MRIFMTVTDLLLDCLELCKSTRMAMDVYHQCQLSDNYGFIAKVSVTLLTFSIQWQKTDSSGLCLICCFF